MASLHSVSKLNMNQISDTDRIIAAYIDSSQGSYYDTALSQEKSFQVFFQLSELRTGLINWYEFKKNSEILEIGAGFGALTGRLCQMCGHVTATERSAFRAEKLARRYCQMDNLDIYAGDLSEILEQKQQKEAWKHKFDYVLLTGLLERVGGGSCDRKTYVEYLQNFQKLLKSDGKLLLAVENRFGLRYFCGAVEPHTNRPFDGIRNYPGGGGHSFSKQELKDILQEAGLARHKFYYPLPDYKLPQLIYTDEHLPEKNLKERLIPYYQRNNTLIAHESELYDEVISNEVFPFFANSFFVECVFTEKDKKDDRGKSSFCGVQYAALSTDRGRERSFATTIHAEKLVRKTPLYVEGKDYARKVFQNIQDLKQHDIPVVEHRINEEGVLTLPYVPYPTLSNYIKKIMGTKQEEFLEILDKIYAYILQSSEICEESEEYGPVMKRAYMELIPLNCFYNPETKEFLYFDQEFVRDKCPAKYVLFRAIHYIYCFTPNAESCYPKQKLLEKYNMVNCWEHFLQEEAKFLEVIRNQKQYSQFYRWAQVDENRIRDNVKRLESEEETIAEYKISDKMKKIWRVELQMLDEIDRICSKYGLKYFLVHGSLLGAVRHSGFIPWDDDLDVAMLREDYDRFLEVAQKELQEPLSVHTPFTERTLFWGGYARMRNSLTTAIETKELGHAGNLGIWVDILPMDTCTMDEEKFVKQQFKIRHYHRMILARFYGREFHKYGDMNVLQWHWYRILAACCSSRYLVYRLDRVMRMYNREESENIVCLSGYFKHRRLNKKDFADSIFLDFENRRVPVPVGYEDYLFMSLGKDYLKYPPQEERKPKHRGIYDPDRPYTDYTAMLCNIFQDIKGKEIILFGAGMMFEDYMKKYGDKYRPDFLVDNDENKWGRSRMGIEIRRPEAILEVPEHKRKLIICSFYYTEIEKQLKELGIKDYQVYVQEVEWIIQAEKDKK